jgi:hypothetical protein
LARNLLTKRPRYRSATETARPVSRVLRAPLAAAVGLTIAGCSVATVTTTSTPHFIAKASKICRRTNLEIESLPVPNDTPASEAGIARHGVAYASKELRSLERLTPPKKLRHTYYSALGAVETLVTIGRQEVADYADNRLPQAEVLVNRGESLTAIADTAMSTLGLTDCAADPQPSAAA